MYDVYGKVTEVRERSSGSLKVNFVYNAAGMRVEKAAYTNATNYTTTYYAYAGGGLSAVYSAVTTGGATGLTTHDVSLIYGGGGRLGTAYLTNASVAKYVFEVKDHLGNVRATFRRLCLACSTVYIENYADYYPYGWALPGRNGSNGAAYRYGFQGEFAEKDPETGWTAFELRMYESRAGRWMTVDPAKQFHSPYVGMGNDPVNGIDPNGAYIEYEGSFGFKLKAWTHNLIGRIFSPTFRNQYRELKRSDKLFVIRDIKDYKYYGHIFYDADGLHSPRFSSNSWEYNDNLRVPLPDEVLSADWVDPHIYHDSDGTGDGGTIYFNLTKDFRLYLMENNIGNRLIVHGHEFAHAVEAMRGVKSVEMHPKYNSPIKEVNAMMAENRIRAELNRFILIKDNRFMQRSLYDYFNQGNNWKNYLINPQRRSRLFD